jgi:hypothetical protein
MKSGEIVAIKIIAIDDEAVPLILDFPSLCPAYLLLLGAK